jgi:hypothetical protein
MSLAAYGVGRDGRPHEEGHGMSSVMSEHGTADTGLIDVNGLSLAELRDQVDSSSLESALDLIFDLRLEEHMHNEFNSHI